MEVLCSHWLPVAQPASHLLASDRFTSLEYLDTASCSSNAWLPLKYNSITHGKRASNKHARFDFAGVKADLDLDQLRPSRLLATSSRKQVESSKSKVTTSFRSPDCRGYLNFSMLELGHGAFSQRSAGHFPGWERVTLCRALAVEEEETSVESDEEARDEEAARHGAAEGLSARERRKLRNERRLENQVGRREANERKEELLMRRSKKQSISDVDLMTLDHLATEGPRWYILNISASGEPLVMEDIREGMAAEFPDVEYEMFYPTLPSCHVTTRNKLSTSPIKLQPGSLYLRLPLTKPLYTFFRRIPRVRGFYGRRVGRGMKVMVVPVPVLDKEVEDRQQMVAEGIQKYEAFKEKFEREREEAAKAAAEEKEKRRTKATSNE